MNKRDGKDKRETVKKQMKEDKKMNREGERERERW